MSEIHGRIVSVHVCTGYSHKGSRFLPEKSRHWSTGPQVHRSRVWLDPHHGSKKRSASKVEGQSQDVSSSYCRPLDTRGFYGRRLPLDGHCSMMSLRFSCRMVSLTAWKTKRMFSVSTAVVKWWKSGFPRFLLLRLNDCTRNAWRRKETNWVRNWVTVGSLHRLLGLS